MEKRGFTLAEVLITLSVIGIVAALTIPSLVNNVDDSQNKTAWKKAYADIFQVTQQLIIDNGGSLIGAFPNGSIGSEDFKNAFVKKINTVKECSGVALRGGSGAGASVEGCWHMANSWYALNGNGRASIDFGGAILSNGMLMHFLNSSSTCSTITSNYGGDYTRCAWIYVDVNGFKGPNIVGKDIYEVQITENAAIPGGARGYRDPSLTCIEGSTVPENNGIGCGAKYLYQ